MEFSNPFKRDRRPEEARDAHRAEGDSVELRALEDSPLEMDMGRFCRAATALQMLVDEIDLGAAEPRELEPAVEFVEEYLFAFLLPALRYTVGPHLLSTGAVRALPCTRGPGEDLELEDAVRGLRSGLNPHGVPSCAVEDARILARCLMSRAERERELIQAWDHGLGEADGRQRGRLVAAFPDLLRRRALADRLLEELELPA